MSTNITILVPCRVKPSSGEVSMTFTRLAKNEQGRPVMEKHILGNDYGEHWVTFPAGCQFEVISGVEKTDTWCLAVLDGGEPKGLVLRRAAFVNLQAAADGHLQEFLIKRAAREATKATKQAPTTRSAVTKSGVKIQVIGLDPVIEPKAAEPEAAVEVKAPEVEATEPEAKFEMVIASDPVVEEPAAEATEPEVEVEVVNEITEKSVEDLLNE